MKTVFLTIFVFYCVLPSDSKMSILKRPNYRSLHFDRRRLGSAMDYCDQIVCATGRGCLDFVGYGCWCGLPQLGKKPVDEIDQCCKSHDKCYQNAMLSEFCLAIHFEPYIWQCTKDENGNKKAICDESNKKCQKIACECDKTTAECLAAQKYPKKKPTCPVKKFVPFIWMKHIWETL